MAQGDHRGSVTASVNSVTNPTVLSGSVASVAVGDLVFGVFAQQTALTATTTVTDNLGNTYSYVNAGTDAGNATIRCFYARVTTGGTLTTVNVPATASTNDASAIASVIEGPFATSILDANPANATDGTSPHTCTATGTLAQGHEVVMAACALASNNTMTATSPGQITQTVARANVSCAVSRTVVTVTTTVTPEFGNGATANAAQTTASFKLRYQPIDAVASSYAITGTDAATQHKWVVGADGGSYAISGTNAATSKGQTLAADAGSYAVSGTDSATQHRWVVGADAGSYATAGTDAALEHDKVIDAGGGTYAVTGTDAALDLEGNPDKVLDADGGSYSVSGTDATVDHVWTLAANSGSYAVSGTDASPGRGAFIDADGGSYSVTGTDAAPLHGWAVVADAGSYSVSGTDAAADRTWVIDAGGGSYAVSGTDASQQHNTPNKILAADGGSYSVTGTDAGIEKGLRLDADAESYTLTGTDAGLIRDLFLTAGAGSIVLTGADASLEEDREVVAESGSYDLSGADASSELSRVIIAGLGEYVVAGGEAGLINSGEAFPITPVPVEGGGGVVAEREPVTPAQNRGAAASAPALPRVPAVAASPRARGSSPAIPRED